MSKIYVNDRYMMLLDTIYFNGKKIGNVSDDDIDWGGGAAEYIRLFTAQVHSVLMKKIKKKDATNLLKLTLIELVPQSYKDVMGGEVDDMKWEAPSKSVLLEGSLKILCGAGQTVEVRRMTLDGAVRGKTGGDDPLGIECKMETMKPPDSSSPFSFDDTTPFISVTPISLSSVKGGEKKTVSIEASGTFSVEKVPTGFNLEVVNGRITITADTNIGAVRNGTVEFTLAADNTQKATLMLSQTAGSAQPMRKNVEIEAAGALLDVGVSLPFSQFKMPLRRKPVSVRVIMKRPCLGSRIQITRLYLQLGITYEEAKQSNKHEEVAFLAIHGRRVSKMVSLATCRGTVSSLLLSGIVTWLLRWFVPDKYLQGANQRSVILLGTRSFMRVIESVQVSNPLKPRES